MEGVEANLLSENFFHYFELFVHGLSPCIGSQIVKLILNWWTIKLIFDRQIRNFNFKAAFLIVQARYFIYTVVKN